MNNRTKGGRTMKKKLLSITAIFALIMCMCLQAAFASDGTESSGNVFTGESVLSGKTYSNELFWYGDDLAMSRSTVKGDVFAAGQTLIFANNTMASGLRACGQNIDVNGTTTAQSAMLCGETINVNNASDLNSAYMAGQEINFDGTAKCVRAAGQDVTINGKVDGDVYIHADKVVIGDNADISGDLNVTASKQPKVSDSAKIGGETNVTIHKSTFNEMDFLALKGMFRLFCMAATVLIALALCLIMGRHLNDAKEMVTRKPGMQFLSGLIALIAVPVAIVAFCFTLIGIPLAVILGSAYALILMVSTAFAGSALGRLVFKKWNVWPASLLGALILSAVKIVPILGGLVSLGAMLFTLGWVVQYNWNKYDHKKKASPDVEVTVEK